MGVVSIEDMSQLYRYVYVHVYNILQATAIPVLLYAVKAAKYADQDNFIPFILETGGRVNKVARDWLGTLTAPEPGEQVPSQDNHPWNPQTRTTTETVRREAIQACCICTVHVYVHVYHWYTCTMVPWYTCTVFELPGTYTCTASAVGRG